jgi:DNA-binding MarR family transcriptional regulator
MGTPDPAAVWGRLRMLVLEHGDHRVAVARALGLSHLRGKALGLIAERPRPLSELAADLMVDKPYTSVMVRDLIERGLAESTPHPHDRRSKIVRATPAGVDLAARRQLLLNEPPAAVGSLPVADLMELDRILDLLLGRIHEGTQTETRSGGV